MSLPTTKKSDFCANLTMLSALLEGNTSLDSSLKELAHLVAQTLKTDNCSIMLLKEGLNDKNLCLRVQAHYGNLPIEAYEEYLPLGKGFAGKVAQTGEPMLVEDIANADTSSTKSIPGGFITFPILLNERIVGVVNVNTPSDNHTFNQADLELASILSLFIAKSIQKLYLQNTLKSQFTLAAVAKEQNGSEGTQVVQEPYKLVKILAKSFFNDMHRIGLERDHILAATTELIDLLSEEIKQKNE